MTLIEPAMLVFMGVVIAGIVLALYLPLFQLTSVMGGNTLMDVTTDGSPRGRARSRGC